MERGDLYRFQVANVQFDGFIKLLLRSYTGLFTEFVSIDEASLARKANIDPDRVYQFLIKLSNFKIPEMLVKQTTDLIQKTC